MDDTEMRARFETVISGSPYERSVERYPDNGRSAWPGNYRDIAVDLAWCVVRDMAAAPQTESCAFVPEHERPLWCASCGRNKYHPDH
jgi:hypothetical protein